MAHQYVALLRGINVGKAKRVAMADLRALIEELGYFDVRTLLNSGNVVFGAKKAAPRAAESIEKAMTKQLGVSARVLVLSAEELEAAAAANPLGGKAEDPSRLLLAFLFDAADAKRLEPLLAQDWGSEVLALGPRVAYLWCPQGILDSRLPEAVGKTLGDAVTTRNWATVLKLQALLRDPGKPAKR